MKSVYIHIPFCNKICSYCDFAKMHYHKEWVEFYLNELQKEIDKSYDENIINTIYIGGGTPSSLTLEEIKKLFKIVNNFKLSKDYEFTFECNIENIDQEKMEYLYQNGVNRLSIGVQTFNEKFLKYLNRDHHQGEVINKINMLKKIGFKSISIDLIYAIPGQTIDDLKSDIDLFLSIDINHISTYSLIIEPNTVLHINKTDNIDDEIDDKMYNLIIEKLESNGFRHYETSNFAKDNYESRHNLVYWNNNEYYGFGLGASGYINGVRYENTRSINQYLKGNYRLEEHLLTKLEQMQNEMILGLRKIRGVNKKIFKDKYNVNIEDVFKIDKLIEEGKLIDDNENIYIAKKYLYLANEILIAFID